MSAILLNAQSLINKLDDFQTEIIEQHSPSVIFVTETWLSSDYPDNLINQDSLYNVFRKDRTSNSGGVLIMVRKELSCAALEHRCFGDLDLVVVRARVHCVDVIFACFYRSSVTDVHLLKPLTEAIDYLLNLNMLIYLCGDFNLPGIKWNNRSRPTTTYKQDKFMDLFRSRGLSQHVTQNTRGANILDLVFTNEVNAVHCLEIIAPLSATADHDCVLFSLNLKETQCENRPIFKWRNMNTGAMRSELELVNWVVFFSDCVTCEDMWLKFKLLCHSLIAKYVPIFQVGTNTNRTSRYVRKALAKKRASYKNRHKSTAHMERYKQLRAICKYIITEDTLKRESKVLFSPNQRKFYTYVNKKLSSRPTISGIVDSNGELLYNDRLIAEKFNAHYKSVFTTDNGRDVDMPLKCDIECNNILFTRKSVCDSICELSNGFACGPDGLPPYFYKQLSAQVAIPLHAIFEKSFDSGYVPFDWRSAVVTPAFKGKGKRAEPVAYRPISLTCFASRIMERIIKNHVSQHLDNNNLLSSNQHGFVKNRSTETQLLECFNHFTKHFDNKDCVDVVYLDISKAFDTVCHNKLFSKLSKYGISGKLFSWIRAFLSDRKQSVIVNGKMSSAVEISSGVPQGSVQVC
jgi:hypothetical protein